MSETLTPAPASTYVPPVPADIRERGKAADEMIRAFMGNANGNPPPSDPATPETPPETLPAPAEQPLQAPPLPTPTHTPTGDSDLQARLDRAEQDARTWRGRFDAEQRARQDDRALMESLRASVEALKANATPSTPPPPAYGEVNPLNDKEIDDFGPDLMEAVARHAAATVLPRVDVLVKQALEGVRGEFAPMKTTVEQVARTSEEAAWDSFAARLGEQVPQWRTVDVEPGFLDWLAQEDPMMGTKRKDALDAAVQSRHVGRVSAFFRAYLDQRGGAASPTGQQPPIPPEGESPASLADMAAPGKARGADPASLQGPGGKKVWKLSEIRAHASKLSRGGYSNPAEKDRIDRDIADAQREGRVDLYG